MRIVKGTEEARRILLAKRGLDLDSLPPQVRQRSQEIFGETRPLRIAEAIVSMVRERGDEAIRSITKRVDGIDLGDLEVSRQEIAEAYGKVETDLVQALGLAAERVRKYHQITMPRGWVDYKEGYGEIVNPVGSAGAYVPGGTARYPSTVIMTAVPAKVAGVEEVVIATPPGKDGLVHPAVLVAADIAGVDRVFRIGGAQAIAAMAYGTATVPRVDLVCGPGNIFVTLAKKLVFGEVGIDGLYGPTETVVLADASANPTLCAADLLAQAEHDEMARPVLITTSEQLANSVNREVGTRVQRLERANTARHAVETQGLIAVVSSINEAFDLANAFAPEHMSIMFANPWQYVGRVRNAGAVFLGDFSHEVLGDYVAGPSHVMPTGGTARFGSGLNVRSFLKFTPVVGLDENTSYVLARSASVLGRAEGLTAHAEAAEVREEILKR